jgi:hypothetical protein
MTGDQVHQALCSFTCTTHLAYVAAGLALEPIRVYADDLDGTQAAAAPGSSSSRKAQLAAAPGSSSSSSAAGGFDWQSLWGSDNSSDAAVEAPSAGSFLLGALPSFLVSWFMISVITQAVYPCHSFSSACADQLLSFKLQSVLCPKPSAAVHVRKPL